VGQLAARVGLTRSDIVVTTASGIHARPIAEFVLMSILMFVKEAFALAEDQRAHRWQRYATEELAGKMVTIVGVGRIGREIARAVHTFDAHVVGTVRSVDGRSAEDLCVDALLPGDRVDELLPTTDFLVLCCPHTPETQGLINAERLAALKPGAVVINVARGAVVDEPALIEALRAGRLRGAALDVFAREPLPPESPLWDMPNVLICPHSASTAITENGKIVDLFCDNMRRYLAGEPLRNVLNKQLLY
jgi:phosphoglycerate dehydrogenase-like enzyme